MVFDDTMNWKKLHCFVCLQKRFNLGKPAWRFRFFDRTWPVTKSIGKIGVNIFPESVRAPSLEFVETVFLGKAVEEFKTSISKIRQKTFPRFKEISFIIPGKDCVTFLFEVLVSFSLEFGRTLL